VSIYKDPKSPYYQYSFAIERHRFHGSTKCTSRREAEKREREIYAQREAEIKAAASGAKSLRLDDVGGRYWNDIGQHHAGSENKLLTEITHEDVAAMVATRRQDVVPNSKPLRQISPFTVNDTTEQLKKLFTYCKARGVEFDAKRMPKWRELMLDEPEERVRELHVEEAERLDEAMRDDYAPLFDFCRVTGKRKTECYTLRWDQVHFDTGWIERPGKGGRTVRVRITPTVRAILGPLRGDHPEFVFTYVAQRTIEGKFVKGQRYPMTKSGLNTRWRRTRKEANLTGFRFHDFRHDVATKVLRETRNLKTVQKLLDHRDLKTTLRYAHVLDEEVGDAMEAVATKSLRNHPKNHPSAKLKTG
jgi:integrase